MDRTTENKQAVRDAERQLKLSKRKDYYKILEVDRCAVTHTHTHTHTHNLLTRTLPNGNRSASSIDIKKAYRKMALRHHPGM